MSTPIPDMTAADLELEAELARLGVTGQLVTGPLGVAAPPRDSMGPWANTMIGLGYISDDGLEESRDEDREEFVPWQAKAPIRTEETRDVVSWQATLWETKAATVSLYYKTPVTEMEQHGTGDAAVVSFVEKIGRGRDLRPLGIDVLDDVYHRRMFAPLTEVTERGAITYNSATLIGYQCTITAYPGIDGYSVLRIFKEGWELPDGETTP